MKKIDDERMKTINQSSAANAFWTMINTAIFFGVFGDIIADFLPFTQSQLMNYDATAILFTGFLAYFGFRTYYLKHGLENEFWRFD